MKIKTLFSVATLLSVAMQSAWAGQSESFVEKLNQHYKNTLTINAFSLRYHFLNKQYRDNNYWDFRTPNRVMSQRMVEVDMSKKHFYDNDILYYSGGRLFDRAQFQNDKESLYYEKSATTYGKAIINKGLGNYDRFIGWMVKNVDFLVIRPLLEEKNIEQNITVAQDKIAKVATLTHQEQEGASVVYKFNLEPLQLMSVYQKSNNYLTTYEDHQTSRELTYARSVKSYANGAVEPTYIKYIDQFEVINQVDPAKLHLPEGYGPEVDWGDGVLTSEEISKDLYLVTDSGATINSLFKVTGNKIRIFGASAYGSLAEKTIKLIQQQFPNKHISSIYVTHPHGHQIAGLKIYADLGIEILADDYTIEGIKAYASFASDIHKFKFKTLKHEQMIDEAQFFVLDNLHSKQQSFVHFKDSGVIFQAHFLHVPLDNTIAKVIPNYTRTFIDFIREKQLNFHRIVGNYRNNNISVEVVNKTYDAPM